MLSARKCYSMLVVHNMYSGSFTWSTHILFWLSVAGSHHGVGGGGIGERGVREQIVMTIPSFICKERFSDTSCHQDLCDCWTPIFSSDVHCLFSNWGAQQWQMASASHLSSSTFHKTWSNWYASTFGTFMTNGSYKSHHFITTGVCVEWWTKYEANGYLKDLKVQSSDTITVAELSEPRTSSLAPRSWQIA